MAKKGIVDLSKMNLSYEDRTQKIKLLTLIKNNMTIEVEIYEKDSFIKNDIIAFAHIPKKLKAKINPLC